MDISRIASVGTSLPPCRITQSRSKELMLNHYGSSLNVRSRDVLCKMLEHPGIQTRAFAFGKEEELPGMKNEDPDLRAERFRKWAVKLGMQASHMAISNAGLDPKEITALIVNTCTGYICPGLSTYLVEEMELNATIKVYDLVGSGCGGAVPNLQLASALALQGETVLSLAVEICSATFEMGNDLSLIVSNSIFGDGAAAMIVWNREQGISLISTQSIQFPKYREDIRYVHKGGRLHNQLSHHLPKIIGKMVPKAVQQFLNMRELNYKNIQHWFIHPGGDRMLNSLQETFSLNEKQMKYAREVMRNCGNMSSPTVLFELEKHLTERAGSPGDLGLMLAFGAGLSIHMALLEW